MCASMMSGVVRRVSRCFHVPKQCRSMHRITSPTLSLLSVRFLCTTPSDHAAHSFGNRVIDSTSKSNQPYLSLAQAAVAAIGSEVTLRGRVSTIRKKGKMTFICLRSTTFETIQCIHFAGSEGSQSFRAFLNSLTEESIIDITGTLAEATVKSCSITDREVVLRDVFVISAAPAQLPFHLKDAARYITALLNPCSTLSSTVDRKRKSPNPSKQIDHMPPVHSRIYV